MTLIRTLFVAVNLLFGTGICATLVVVAALVGVKRPEYYAWIGRNWSRWMIWSSGSMVEIEGLEHVRMDRPQILVGNHQSWFDVWAVAASMPKVFHFIAKKELGYIPLFGQAWKAAGHISIDRSDRASAIQSLERASRQLERERSAVVIFPEGTRSPTGELLPFKKGAFMLALLSGDEIVPFGVSGTREILPKGGWRVRPGRIKLRFGEPIPTERYDVEQRDALIERTRGAVKALVDPPAVVDRRPS